MNFFVASSVSFYKIVSKLNERVHISKYLCVSKFGKRRHRRKTAFLGPMQF
jgi:hypothetical protein